MAATLNQVGSRSTLRPLSDAEGAVRGGL